MSGTLDNQLRETSESMKKFGNQVDATISSNSKDVKVLVKRLHDDINREDRASLSFKGELQELARNIDNLNKSIDKIKNITSTRRQSIWEFLKSLLS